jgi:hypothetical protein
VSKKEGELGEITKRMDQLENRLIKISLPLQQSEPMIEKSDLEAVIMRLERLEGRRNRPELDSGDAESLARRIERIETRL